MGDEAHVGFIDPHAESDSCHHHLNVIPLKGLLHPFTFAVFHSGMIAGGGNASFL